jgi:hypothetical protein
MWIHGSCKGRLDDRGDFEVSGIDWHVAAGRHRLQGRGAEPWLCVVAGFCEANKPSERPPTPPANARALRAASAEASRATAGRAGLSLAICQCDPASWARSSVAAGKALAAVRGSRRCFAEVVLGAAPRVERQSSTRQLAAASPRATIERVEPVPHAQIDGYRRELVDRLRKAGQDVIEGRDVEGGATGAREPRKPSPQPGVAGKSKTKASIVPPIHRFS